MTKSSFVLTATAIAAVMVTLALPAAAHDFGFPAPGPVYSERPSPMFPEPGRYSGSEFDRRQSQIERRIDRSFYRGDLSLRQARFLTLQARDLGRLADQYRDDGLNRWEYAELDRRFTDLEVRLFQARHGEYGFDNGGR